MYYKDGKLGTWRVRWIPSNWWRRTNYDQYYKGRTGSSDRRFWGMFQWTGMDFIKFIIRSWQKFYNERTLSFHPWKCSFQYLTFFNGMWPFIIRYRKCLEKSFKSFSLLANALSVGIPAESLGSGILQPGIGMFQPDWCLSDFWGIVFLKDIFRLKHFVRYILQPECRQAGCLRSGWKIWRKNKAVRHVDAVMEKNNRPNFKKPLFFPWKRLVLFLKGLVLFGKGQDVWKVGNVWGATNVSTL